MPSNLQVTARKIAGKATLIVAGIVVACVLGTALYVWTTLHWAYSEGDRSGLLQKFSHKGWVCKTYEGELAVSYTPGLAPTIWTFTVRDPAVAEKVNASLGKRVVLQYEEHQGVPSSCFGDTPYFVSSVRLVE